MDYGSVIHKAQKNERQGGTNEIKYYPTKFEPPKKEQRQKSQLSVNIQKFLARKEEEERQKQHETRIQRDKLLELRAKDKKATKRVNVMLKRTKSANQSVLAEAVDANDTSVTLAGPSQPDEDDYGYVSQSASDFYNKMMEKYSKIPDEPKFDLAKKKVSTNLSSTKDRVRAALEKEREEAMLPHKRKRKHKDQEEETGDNKKDNEEDGKSEKRKRVKIDSMGSDSEHTDEENSGKRIENDSSSSRDKKPNQKPKVPRPSGPPPINFADLLKIAEKKQHEPVVVEKKRDDDNRLFTKKQRREFEREQQIKENKERRDHERIQNLLNPHRKQTTEPVPTKVNDLNDHTLPKIGKKKSQNTISNDSQSSNSQAPDLKKPKVSENKSNNNGINKNRPELDKSRPQGSKTGANTVDSPQIVQDRNPVTGRKYLPGDIRAPKQQVMSSETPKKQSNIDINRESKQRPQIQTSSANEHRSNKQIMSSTNEKTKQSRGIDDRTKQAPPIKQFPPADLKPKQFPPPDVMRSKKPQQASSKLQLAQKGRRIIDDDDDEYDSEMDDFIDDDDLEEDYSSHIKQIFGYDKRKYKDYDDDVDDMETSFAQQMKEEVISTKLGIEEDLEDMRKEEEHKKRKAMMKKKLR